MTPLERLEELAHNAKLRRLDFAQEMHDIVDELRSEMPETGVRAAWAAVVDALYEVRPDWDETAGKSSMENAVAAIRSMAAQCSAQTAAADDRPAGVPPLPSIWIDALGYAAGFLHTHDRSAIARELRALGSWLVANAPRT